MAYRLAFYKVLGKPFYVMVQHGFSHLAIECGATKKEVQRMPLPVAVGRRSFRQWAKALQRKALGLCNTERTDAKGVL